MHKIIKLFATVMENHNKKAVSQEHVYIGTMRKSSKRLLEKERFRSERHISYS